MKRTTLTSIAFLLFANVACGLSFAAESHSDEKLSEETVEFFENKVRPLLARHCYECHSAEAKEVKGGLRLDTKQGWISGGDSGTAVEPGNVAGSLLLTAVRYEDFEMPPKGKISQEEIAVLERWVDMGAPDPRTGSANTVTSKSLDLDEARKFWAFQPAQPHPAPQVRAAEWPLDELDRFVLSELESKGLAPAPDADRRTWLRRVTFDLTGLPPAPADFEIFIADESPEAYARVVDRLLQSPHFGEHWGRHWLDVARYADSNGSDFNATFYYAWRYRNYVIESFNRDKPFDKFVREQIAGDLLPYEDDQQRATQLIATGFLSVGPKMLSERDKEKLLMDVIDEQIDTVGRAIMALTLGCARCHDHKFDPVPTEDYYALAGIFGSTETLFGESQQYVSAWRDWELPHSPEVAAKVAAHQQQVSELKKQREKAHKDEKAAKDQLARLSQPVLAGVVVDDTEAQITGHWKPSTLVPTFVGKGYIHDDKTDLGKKSITFIPAIPQAGRYEIRLSYAGTSGRATNVPVSIQHADGVSEILLNQSLPPPIDNMFKSVGVFRFEAGGGGSVTITNKDTDGFVIADAAQFIPTGDTDTSNSGSETSKTSREVSQWRAKISAAAKRVKELDERIKQLAAKAPKVPKAMGVRDQAKPSDCQVCIRGQVHNRGTLVPRGFVQVLAPDSGSAEMPADSSGRAELAAWITRPDHPLTARVMVNRVWQHLLGEGIVRSVDNFGKLGERPSHPALLDRLTVDFVDDGWSVKRLIRRIALSRTYRIGSGHRPEAFRVDPENRLLWRANRKRLTAESLRDGLLSISGQLDVTPQGSPVKGLGKLAIDNNANSAGSGKTAGLKCRSIYLPIVRNDLPEFLAVFDFADPDIVTGRRAQTTVPAQALMLMNSPFVRTAAGLISKSVVATADNDAARLDRLYIRVMGRFPSDAERQRAVGFVETRVADDKNNSKQTHAAWTQVCQALLASTEFRFLD